MTPVSASSRRRIAALVVMLSVVAVATSSAESQQQTSQAGNTGPLVPPGYQYVQPLAYPAQEQTAEKIAADTNHCHIWSKQQNMGFDARNPLQTVPAGGEVVVPEAEKGPTGGALRGGARGAAMGAAIGAATGDAGTGAAVGAAAGGFLGAAKSRKQREASQQQQEQQAQAQHQARYDAFRQMVARYDRAFTLCMQSRGYTVG